MCSRFFFDGGPLPFDSSENFFFQKRSTEYGSLKNATRFPAQAIEEGDRDQAPGTLGSEAQEEGDRCGLPRDDDDDDDDDDDVGGERSSSTLVAARAAGACLSQGVALTGLDVDAVRDGGKEALSRERGREGEKKKVGAQGFMLFPITL